MAKWGIRFQRFALSFRLSALDVCRFRSVLQPLALSLQPLLVFWAMPKGNPLSTNINTTILGTGPFTRLLMGIPMDRRHLAARAIFGLNCHYFAIVRPYGTKEACYPSVK